MKAIILAGGQGTRLRPLTLKTSKHLIEVQGKTLTEQVFDIVKKHGVTEVILSLGYLADQIKSYFSQDKDFGLKIDYLIEDKPLGTAAPLVLMKRIGCPFIEDFLVINGDNLFSGDLTSMMKFHKSHSGVATVALTEVEDPSTYGATLFEGDRILKFVEKPKKDEAPSNFINTGYYILSPKIFDFVPDKEPVSMEYDIFPVLAEAGLLYGFRGNGQWFDTGTYERYEQVKKEWRGV